MGNIEGLVGLTLVDAGLFCHGEHGLVFINTEPWRFVAEFDWGMVGTRIEPIHVEHQRFCVPIADMMWGMLVGAAD